MVLHALLCMSLLRSAIGAAAQQMEEECDATNLLSTSLHVHRHQRAACADGDFESRAEVVEAGFESDGIMISVITDSSGSPLDAPEHTSASVIRKDLPFTTYQGNIGKFPYPYDSFVHGIIFQPLGCSYTPKFECGYTNDGFTSGRNPPCSAFPTYPDTSGACNFSTAEEYAEYYLTPPGSESVFMFGKGLCFSDAFGKTLDAQVAFYNGMALSTTFKFPGPPLYDELIVGTFLPEGVLGIFWAHAGGFADDPAKVKELGGCFTKAMLQKVNYSLPVLEFANMDWPGKMWSVPSLYREYLDEMLARNKKGGYKASDVMRLMNSSLYTSALFSDCPAY